MAYRFFCLVGLFFFLPALIPPEPAIAREIIRNWQRIQQNQRMREGNTQESRMQGNEEGVQEIHGATSRENCRKMAANFQKQGRKVRLVSIIPSTNPGATLRFNCVFQGEDATAGWYDERRY